MLGEKIVATSAMRTENKLLTASWSSEQNAQFQLQQQSMSLYPYHEKSQTRSWEHAFPF